MTAMVCLCEGSNCWWSQVGCDVVGDRACSYLGLDICSD